MQTDLYSQIANYHLNFERSKNTDKSTGETHKFSPSYYVLLATFIFGSATRLGEWNILRVCVCHIIIAFTISSPSLLLLLSSSSSSRNNFQASAGY